MRIQKLTEKGQHENAVIAYPQLVDVLEVVPGHKVFILGQTEQQEEKSEKKNKTKLQTSWLILPQKRQESAFQSVTETITTSIQPNQLTSQNQVFEIWSKGYKMKRWSTGKQQKTIFTENYKYHNTKRTMEPSRHSKPQHLTSMTVGSERSILFSVGREENLENVPFYPLSRNLIQLHTHTKEGRGTEDKYSTFIFDRYTSCHVHPPQTHTYTL